MKLRFLASLGASLALLACTDQPQAQADVRPPLEGARIGGPFTLIDQDGQATTDQSFAGKYRIMYFGYTYCPDVCPVDVQHIGAAMKLLEREKPELARRIVPVFVTIDPERDTPQVLKQFVSAFHPRMVGLTGPRPAIDAAAKAHGIYAARGKGTEGGYLMDHSRQTYLMDPDGKPLALLPQEQSPRAVADEILRWAT